MATFLILMCFPFLMRRFSQTFIDIREKERKRGARGLLAGNSMQRDEGGANAGAATITASHGRPALVESTTEAAVVVTPSKDLLELQEKMRELQVSGIRDKQ